MPPFDRREFLKMLGVGAATTTIPGLTGCSKSDDGSTAAVTEPLAVKNPLETFYDLPMQGNARILHITDVHGQLNPVYFREPNVNLGVGDAYGRPPHIVGKGLLDYMGFNC